MSVPSESAAAMSSATGPVTRELRTRFQTASTVAAGAVTATGVAVLVGWAFDVTALKSILPGLTAMKANTALLFVLLGMALWVSDDRSKRPLRTALGLGVTIVATLTLLEYVVPIDLGIDQLLFDDAEHAPDDPPGRMAIATALNFLMFGLAVVLFDVPAALRLRQGAVLLASGTSFVGGCGYLFGVRSLYSVFPYVPVALHTVGGFLLAAVAFAFAPGQGAVDLLASGTAAGRLLRRLLPAIIVVPVLVGWMTLAWQRLGWYDSVFGLSIVVFATVVSLGVVAWVIAGPLDRAEMAQRGAYEALSVRERELAETLDAVRASEARHRAVVDAALDAVVTIDWQGRIVEFNPAAERMFGYRRDEVLNQPMADCLVPPSLRESHLAGFARHLDSGRGAVIDKVVEMSARRADGTEFPCELAVFRVPGQSPPLFTGYIRDISERTRSVERFRLALEAAPTGMLMVDEGGRVVLVNSLVERLFGYGRAELLGTFVDVLCPERFRARHPGLRLGFLADPEARAMGDGRDIFGSRRDGSEFPVEIGLTPIETADGRFVLASIVDITERKASERLIHESAERFRALVDATAQIVWTADATGAVLDDSPSWRAFTGQTYEEWTRAGWLASIHPEDQERTRQLWRHAVETATPVDTEYRVRHFSGDWRWTAVRAVPLLNDRGDVRGWVGMNVDITDRKRAEEERARLVLELRSLTKELEGRVEDRTKDLRENEARYRALFSDSPVALWEQDYSAAVTFLREAAPPDQLRDFLAGRPDVVSAAAAKVRMLDVNRRGLDLFEAPDREELAGRWADTCTTGDLLRDELLALAEERPHFEAEGRCRTLTGRPLHVRQLLTAAPASGAATRVIVSTVDITAAKAAELGLREAVREQQVLLKEIHHRVKNNLAVISSLLYLESTHTTDTHAVDLLEDSRRRIRSMALVHESLYRSDTLANIDMAEYVRTLATEVLSAYRTRRADVRLAFDLHAIPMSVELAVPCGIILNELLSNAFKHAFPDGRTGVITVSLQAAESLCRIRVLDDGVGLPTDMDVATHRSLGLRLIRSVARQLRGAVEFHASHPGTEVVVTFSLEGS